VSEEQARYSKYPLFSKFHTSNGIIECPAKIIAGETVPMGYIDDPAEQQGAVKEFLDISLDRLLLFIIQNISDYFGITDKNIFFEFRINFSHRRKIIHYRQIIEKIHNYIHRFGSDSLNAYVDIYCTKKLTKDILLWGTNFEISIYEDMWISESEDNEIPVWVVEIEGVAVQLKTNISIEECSKITKAIIKNLDKDLSLFLS